MDDNFKESARAGRSVTVVGAVVNGFLILLKFVAGILGQSQALIADAVHSISDLFTDAVVLVGLKMGRKGPDETHHFGHARIETLASAVVGVALIGTALYLGIKAAWNVYLHGEYHPTRLALVAAAVSIALKEVLYHYTVHVGRRIQSPAVVANAWHHRSDALSSVAVLLGVAGAQIRPSWHVLDAYAALVVSFFILKVGLDVLRNTLREFIDTAPEPEVLGKITQCVKKVDGVMEMHDLRVRTLGGKHQMETHVVVDAGLTVAEGHRIAKSVERCLLDEVPNLDRVIVHVDPGIKWGAKRSETRKERSAMTETRRTYCGLCHSRCGLRLEMENGRAVKVTGDPEHPITRGRICNRGKLMLDHVYHPDRLNYPLKRKGERGAGQWERITWEQALDEVSEKLSSLRDRYGAETLAFTHGTKRTYHWDERRFYNLFGSPNICGANNVCMCPSQAVEYATYGGFTWGDVMQTKCVVLWGHAPSQSDPIGLYAMILAAKKNGARLIVVDPRRIPEAEKADMFLQIRPGTDVALMLGWMRVIIEDEFYDRSFVTNWTVGFEDLKAAVAAYTPERVAEITWLTPEQVVKSARLYAMTKPAIITWGFGLDKQGVNATQAARARALLRSITGNLDVPGGEPLGWADPIGKIIGNDKLEFNEALPSEQRAKQLGADEYPFFGFPGWEKNAEANRRLPQDYMHPPLADMTSVAHARAVCDAILGGKPYPVTAAISLASNPLLSLANTRHVYEALKALQLYVVAEYYLTPSAALADYVFPICSTIETTELWLTPAFCVACPRGIDLLHERRNPYDFWRGLAIRLGQKEHWPWETVDQVWDWCLAPVGLTFQQLLEKNGLFGRREYRRYEQFGFGTPSGKVELRSSILEDLGCEPLPVYREMPHSPAGDPHLHKEYPLVLITGSRFMPVYHSEQRQIERARKQSPDPLVSIHPDTAAGLHVAEGDWVRVVTPMGNIRVRARLTDILDPRMVDVQHGWWFPEGKEADPELFGVFESNANILCPDGPEFCSPEIGGWPHTALLCRVEKM